MMTLSTWRHVRGRKNQAPTCQWEIRPATAYNVKILKGGLKSHIDVLISVWKQYRRVGGGHRRQEAAVGPLLPAKTMQNLTKWNRIIEGDDGWNLEWDLSWQNCATHLARKSNVNALIVHLWQTGKEYTWRATDSSNACPKYPDCSSLSLIVRPHAGVSTSIMMRSLVLINFSEHWKNHVSLHPLSPCPTDCPGAELCIIPCLGKMLQM